MKTLIAVLLLCAGVVLVIATMPARAHDVLLTAAPAPAASPTETAEPAVDLDAFCNAGCKKLTDDIPKGLGHAFCWACCFETCRCKADTAHCANAREACSDHLDRCPDIAKNAPTPPK
jgi:hypothetical protein